MTKVPDYPFEMRPLADDEGGGCLITYQDLKGCMSDGETPEAAIANGEEAVADWIKAVRSAGRAIPAPGEPASGKFVARVPRSLHARLSARAKHEGVSMNALVAAFLAESLGRRDSRRKLK
jgi:antitoxin HicB